MPYYFTIMFMFHCSRAFEHSGIPAAAAKVTACQLKVPLIVISDFHISFYYSCRQSFSLEKASFGVNYLHTALVQSKALTWLV